MIAGLAAKFALTRVGKTLAHIPRWAWILLGVVILLGGSYWLHGRKVNTFEATIRADERSLVNGEWQKKFDTMRANAVTWKQRYETASGQLATARRAQHENNLRTDGARAERLLDTGPGAARCGQVNNPSASAGASGRNPRSGPVDAGVAGMLGQERIDLIGLPYAEAVERFRICDANRSEAITWRGHDTEQRALREKLLTEPSK